MGRLLTSAVRAQGWIRLVTGLQHSLCLRPKTTVPSHLACQGPCTGWPPEVGPLSLTCLSHCPFTRAAYLPVSHLIPMLACPPEKMTLFCRVWDLPRIRNSTA